MASLNKTYDRAKPPREPLFLSVRKKYINVAGGTEVGTVDVFSFYTCIL
jgi:hypothetical protein